MSKSEYDTVIIGSSPNSLLKASIESKKGHSVLIIEKHGKIGGAWRTENCLGLEGIEITPHIIYPHSRSYKALEEYLFADFEEVKFDPIYSFWMSPKKRISFKVSPSRRFRFLQSFHYLFIGNKPYLKKLKRFFSTASKRDYFETWPSRQKHALYPSSGIESWMQRIQKNFKKIGVDILTNTAVKKIDVDENACTITLPKGKKIKCKKIVFSQALDVESLRVLGKKQEIQGSVTYSKHISFILSDNSVETGFIRCIGAEDLALFSNCTTITPRLQDVYPNSSYVAVRTESSKSDPEPINEADYFMKLKKYGLVDKNAKILASNSFILDRWQIERSSCKTIEKLSPAKLEYLPSHPLHLAYQIQ